MKQKKHSENSKNAPWAFMLATMSFPHLKLNNRSNVTKIWGRLFIKCEYAFQTKPPKMKVIYKM